MALIKCKMCGGDMELAADKTFGTCEYCGSTMTLPKVSDEQRAAAFNRGNHFRRIGEFDKALAVYERIVREDETDAEAHWCCALCRFGIEYVEDPSSYEWLPTCHRASFDSFLEDVDYLAAVEYSDGVTRRHYQRDGAKIAEVQRGILATSQNAEPYDVFICYKESDGEGERTRDSLMAQEIYYQLTEQGRKVFFARITLEDVAGTQYEPYIFAALNSAKVMIVVGTKAEHLNAVWVKNEWSRFLAMMKKDRAKLLLPCYAGMDPYDMPEQLSVLQSYDMAKIGFLQDLTRGIAKVLDADKKPEAVKETVVVQQQGGGNVTALLKRGTMALEDGEWAKAEEFFEEVLNQDAECAEAYIGKALTQVKSPNLAALVNKLLEQYATVTPVKDQIPEKREHIRKMLDSCQVTGYLSREELEKLYVFDRGFQSTLAGRKGQRSDQKQFWNTHKQLTRAGQFARGEAQKQLEEAKNALFSQLDARVAEAEENHNAAAGALQAKYDAHIAQADEKAEALYREAAQKREEDYQKLCRDVENSDQLWALEVAAKGLGNMGDYLDARSIAESCRKKAASIREKQAREAAEAEAAAEAQRKAAAQAAERAYEAEKKRKRKITVCTLSAIAAVFVAVLLLTKVIIPGIRYNTAGKLMEEGQYQSAAERYALLGDYKDSQERISEANYLWAESLLAAGQYREAATIYTKQWDYKDSGDKANEANYLWAESLLKEEEYSAAAAAFEALGGYADSDLRIKECHYAIAEAHVAKEEYFAAISLFDSLGDYEDAPAQAQQLRNYLADISYREAEAALDAGDTYQAAVCFGKAGNYKDAWQRCREIWDTYTVHNTLCVENYTVFALKNDGTVVMALNSGSFNDQFSDAAEEIAQWRDVAAIAHGSGKLAALREDGTVAVIGDSNMAEEVSQWTGIVAIAMDYSGLYGLQSDGTVITTGKGNNFDGNVVRLISAEGGVGVEYRNGSRVFNNYYGSRIELGNYGWQTAVMIYQNQDGTAALREDGTVAWIYSEKHSNTYSGIQDWTNITAISGSSWHLMGLKADGTVVATGDPDYKKTSLGNWTDIVALEGDIFLSAGLRSDGTVVCTSQKDGLISIRDWTDIRLPE